MIAIIGNIAVGKSSAGRILSKTFNTELVSIDTFRIRYNQNNSLEGERKAYNFFEYDISNRSFCVFECSGASKKFDLILASLKKKGKDVFVVRLTCSMPEVFRRHNERKDAFNKIPFPYKGKAKAKDTYIYIEGKLANKHQDLKLDTENKSPAEIAAIITSEYQKWKNKTPRSKEFKVKMSTVLSEINRYAESETPKEFSLTYITKDGRVKHCKRLTKSGYFKPKPSFSLPQQSRPYFNVKEKGVLHVFNLETNKPETPLICLLTHFNGIRIWH